MGKKLKNLAGKIGTLAGSVAAYAVIAVLFILAIGLCAAMILGLIALNKWLWGLI